jgi:hypothetical protein
MNLKLNLKDINKKLAKAHFKCKFLNMMRRNNTFLQKHVSMKLLEVSLSYLRFSLLFVSMGSPMIAYMYIDVNPTYYKHIPLFIRSNNS